MRVLTAAVPATVRHKDWHLKINLCEKNDVFILVPKGFFKPGDALGNLAPDEDAARGCDCPFVPQKESDKVRRRDQQIGPDAESRESVTFTIFRPSSPTVPISGTTVCHPGFGSSFENRNLIFELVWKPDVIVIQKSDVLALGMLEAEFTGCAHASILVPIVFEVSDLVAMFRGITYRDFGAPVSRPVVHKKKFPVTVSLGQNAFDCVLKEILAVQEDDDSGDQWFVRHRVVCCSFFALRRDQFRELIEGNMLAHSNIRLVLGSKGRIITLRS
jgi:hypothetical protein